MSELEQGYDLSNHKTIRKYKEKTSINSSAYAKLIKKRYEGFIGASKPFYFGISGVSVSLNRATETWDSTSPLKSAKYKDYNIKFSLEISLFKEHQWFVKLIESLKSFLNQQNSPNDESKEIIEILEDSLNDESLNELSSSIIDQRDTILHVMGETNASLDIIYRRNYMKPRFNEYLAVRAKELMDQNSKEKLMFYLYHIDAYKLQYTRGSYEINTGVSASAGLLVPIPVILGSVAGKVDVNAKGKLSNSLIEILKGISSVCMYYNTLSDTSARPNQYFDGWEAFCIKKRNQKEISNILLSIVNLT